jgi:hypothetical protein
MANQARPPAVETPLTGLPQIQVGAILISGFALADPGWRGDYGEEVRALIINVPDVLREKLGAEGARALAELLNQLGGQVRDAAITVAEERFERRLVETTSALETRLVERMSTLETRLNERMRKLESRLLGWAFAFWLGHFAVLIGILFAFFRD